jgi:hypothetical protein
METESITTLIHLMTKSVVLFNNFQHSSYMDKMGLYIVNFICYNNYPFSFGAIIAVNVW